MGYRAKQRIINWGILNGWEAPEKMFNILNHQGNANQSTPRFYLTPVRTAKIKNTGDSRCSRRSGEIGTLLHWLWDFKMVQPLWKSVWQFLKILDIVLLEDPAIPLLGIYPEDAPTCNKDTYSTMFIAALFIVARSWKEPRCPSTEEWIQKMWYIYTMEYYSAIKNHPWKELQRQSL